MDLRLMIKEMIRQGMSDDDIVANLKAIGVEDVEKAIADALAAEEKVKPDAAKKVEAGEPAKAQTPVGTVDEKRAEEEELEIAGLGGSKSLFEDEKPPKDAEEALKEAEPLFGKGEGRAWPKAEMEEVKPLFGVQEPSKEGKEEADEEIPKLEITKIEGGEEKTTDIASMLNKAGVESAMRPMPQTSLADVDQLERKIDDLLAAVKALQDINRQILEANREMLFRLKTRQ